MPYRKRTYRKKRVTPGQHNKNVRRVVRSELRKEDKKDHPLQWTDHLFTGEYVKTTPTLVSFGQLIRSEIIDNNLDEEWPARQQLGVTDREAKVHITGYNYQLRYQQNIDASGAVLVDTVRSLFYTSEYTFNEYPTALLDGADIDQPPNTSTITSMHSDRLNTLKASITETDGDDSQFVPGQAIVKGWKSIRKSLDFQKIGTGDVEVVNGGDIRFEAQSDDNSLVGEVQVYGFIRVYFRIME